MTEIDAWIVEKVARAIDDVPSMTFFVTRAARKTAVAEAAIAAYEEAKAATLACSHLIESWRKTASLSESRLGDEAETLRRCADDLAAAISIIP
jgi:hypothetical protein